MIIRPIGASGAVSNTLMGIHNTLDSNQQRNIEDVNTFLTADDIRIQTLIAFSWGGISTVVGRFVNTYLISIAFLKVSFGWLCIC